MKEKGVADALLRERLPSALVRRFAGPPQLLSESFVDDRLKGAFADVVIRVPLRGGDDAYVYCLVEHKRTSEARVMVQVLRYLSALYAELAKSTRAKRRLPAVIPLLIYNGEVPWAGPRRFSALLDLPKALRHLTVDFEILLVDVGSESVRAISSHSTLRGGLLGLKAAATPSERLQPVLDALVKSLAEDESTLRLFLEYLTGVVGKEALPSIERAQREVADKEMAMQTVSQFLDHRGYNRGMRHGLKRGLKRGLKQGLEQGLRAALQRVLSRRFKRLPAAVKEKVEAGDAERLQKWLDASIDGKPLKVIFASN